MSNNSQLDKLLTNFPQFPTMSNLLKIRIYHQKALQNIKNICEFCICIASMWKNVEKIVGDNFLSGSTVAKLDSKNRFVLPQSMRYHLVENGVLEFAVGLGLGGCLTIYRKSAIEKIAQKFKEKQHIAKYQKFLTLFFSTLHRTSCDKLGRLSLPSLLKSSVKIQKEIVVAGVIDKIELWPKEVYDKQIEQVLSLSEENSDFQKMSEDAFSLLQESEENTSMEKISESLIP